MTLVLLLYFTDEKTEAFVDLGRRRAANGARRTGARTLHAVFSFPRLASPVVS